MHAAIIIINSRADAPRQPVVVEPELLELEQLAEPEGHAAREGIVLQVEVRQATQRPELLRQRPQEVVAPVA